MKAIEIQHPGKDGSLHLCTRDIPNPKPGEVVIRVAAAGVNRADLLQVKGLYPPPKDASDLPGLEVSGVVASLGEGVRDVKPGDKVCALLQGGGYAEYASVPQETILPIPEGLDMVQAASLPEACFTVWKNFFHLAKLQKNERVLIHAGASGIGVMAIQMAAAIGAEVYATAGSEEKCHKCEMLGAKKAINYTKADFLKEVQAVDVILDLLGGGEYFQKNISVLKPHGRMVTIGLLGGRESTIDIAALLQKNLTLLGSTLRSDNLPEKAEFTKGLKEIIWPLIASGKIVPVVDSTFPLEEAESAHARMKLREHLGKIVLKIQ